MSSSKLTIEGLENLIKSLEKSYKVNVGILGSKTRVGGGISNAQVGAYHEFGMGVPKRSFLRMPLQTNFKQTLEEGGFTSERVVRKMIQDGDIKPTLEKIGIAAVATILKAFDTEGFGTWLPLSPKTMEAKKVKQILTETQQLRNSITYEVEGV